MSIEIASTTENLPDRIQAILPSPDILIRCQAVFAKNEFSTRLENSSHFTECPLDIGKGTKRKCHEHGVHTPVRQGDLFGRSIQELDR